MSGGYFPPLGWRPSRASRGLGILFIFLIWGKFHFAGIHRVQSPPTVTAPPMTPQWIAPNNSRPLIVPSTPAAPRTPVVDRNYFQPVSPYDSR
jgi:hypothetical protein